ncbi:hypothetical protein [Amycolatopsis sp. Hca4]|uniref:hypothetical protein n=1 Tax=Amycolatopsis sp. Hca4 TaxID=2742131 RepID=UPI001590A749|nr:hypothetical protein [Amycolatopsis sp. Hca4]QKV72389.1 hypothetical protein HUT10_00175 [Amycolatopsis sp. Hca4]
MHRITRMFTIGTVAAASLLTASEASAAPAAPQYCAVLVGPAGTPDGVSPELDRYCSSVSGDDARRHLTRPGARTADEAAVAASTLLMTWYENADYGGGSKEIYGSSGTCDHSGYRVTPNSEWRGKLSSATGFLSCNWAEFANPTQIVKFSHQLPVDYIGPEVNDNVGLVKVYHVG